MENSGFIVEDTDKSLNQPDYIIRSSDQGGTSLSYIVRKDGKEYFIKRLKPEFLSSANYRNLFQKEFTIGQSIVHPNIVSYHEFVNDDDDCHILMENISGVTLDKFIIERPQYFKSRRNLDKFFNQLLSALNCLHQNHVVYSDLKPENIMITQVNNDVKLIDLGFCFNDSFSTTAGTTLNYASPEAKNNGKIDVSTDIYGIGKIIEFIGKTSAYNLPGIYSKIMIKCLKTNQADRIQTTEEIVRLINRRNHHIRKSVIYCLISIIFFIIFRSISYNQHVIAWWDSFELLPTKVDYDIEYRRVYYRITDREQKTCMAVGCATNPNLYLHTEVPLNGEIYHNTKIADYAFNNKRYIKSVYIPDGITDIGKSAFSGCVNLTAIEIPNSVTHIDDYAFYACNGLSSVKLPNNLSVISIGTFSGTAAERLSIPEGVTSIELDAFGNCGLMVDIDLPSTLQKIERGVFWSCSSMKKISIPEHVSEIGIYAFFDCSALTDIYNHAVEPQIIQSIHRNPQQITLHVPAASVEKYQATEHWNEMRIVGDL